MLPIKDNEKQLLKMFRKLNERNQIYIQEHVKELVDKQNYIDPENLWISDLDLSTRLKTVLKNHGCKRLRDIIQYSKESILAFRNMGEKLYHELSEVCLAYGITFDETEDLIDSRNVLISDLNIATRMKNALYDHGCERLYDIACVS